MSFVRPIAFSVLPLLLLGAGFVGLGAPDARASSTAASPVNEELEQAMRQMNGAVKGLARGITADNRDEALEYVVKIEHALITAKTMTPDTAAAVDADKRAAFVAEFRRSLVEALKAACDLELAILDGKYDAAQEIMKTQLGALKKAGHDKFKDE